MGPPRLDRVTPFARPRPYCNPIERVSWHLHEAVTRNPRCSSMQESLDLTFAWRGIRNQFQIKGSVYPQAKGTGSTCPVAGT